MIFDKRRILIADDNPSVLNMMSDFLNKKGYQVTAVSDGSLAYEKILISDFDLIVLDINMPKMDGLEAVKAIREHDPHTCIIVMSGEADSKDVREALRCGANQFVPKPFTMNVFMAVIQSIDFPSIQFLKNGEGTKIARWAKRRTPLASRMNFFLRLRKLSFGLVQLIVILLLCIAGGGLAVMLAETKALPKEERPLSDYMERMIDAVKMDWGR